MSKRLRVVMTRDFLRPDGKLCHDDIGLQLLEAAGCELRILDEHVTEIQPAHLRDADALLLLSPKITGRSFADLQDLILVARFGVGYDNVDVEACTRHGVMLTITPDGVRRPVAAAALTFLLALTHKLLIKDRLTRAGRWSEKLNYLGMGVTGRTLGVIGLGNIGREILRLAAPFEMRHVASDPWVRPEDARQAGIDLLPLDELLAVSDYVCVCCALTDKTYHLINGERLSRMKPAAYLINVARGPVVDQRALYEALQSGKIAGAGLDVFEQEPVDTSDPILLLENVIVSPHATCWTDECFRGNGHSACNSILEIAAGRIPPHAVNRDASEHPRFREKLRGFQSESAS